MIQSMTGYAAAEHAADGACYALEIRSLNNRYLKLSVKLPEHLQFLEGDIDKLVRDRLARGSITYTLRVRANGGVAIQPVNEAALQQYLDQLSRVRLPDGVKRTIDLAVLAQLPGVCGAPVLDEASRETVRAIVVDLTSRALDTLIDMRCREGEVLHTDLCDACDAVRAHRAQIAVRVPVVVDEYHQRLKTRVAQLMQTGGFELEKEGLMREVAIYAERSDISEELARLDSHLDQFSKLCACDGRVGRTLDFLTQELLREANTISSKSNDAAITRDVVQMKGLIDRLREQVQNVE